MRLRRGDAPPEGEHGLGLRLPVQPLEDLLQSLVQLQAGAQQLEQLQQLLELQQLLQRQQLQQQQQEEMQQALARFGSVGGLASATPALDLVLRAPAAGLAPAAPAPLPVDLRAPLPELQQWQREPPLSHLQQQGLLSQHLLPPHLGQPVAGPPPGALNQLDARWLAALPHLARDAQAPTVQLNASLHLSARISGMGGASGAPHFHGVGGAALPSLPTLLGSSAALPAFPTLPAPPALEQHPRATPSAPVLADLSDRTGAGAPHRKRRRMTGGAGDFKVADNAGGGAAAGAADGSGDINDEEEEDDDESVHSASFEGSVDGGDGGATGRALMRAGRWSAGEVRRFQQGLARYGRGRWPLVADMVGTRTTDQVRSHAKKHFAKLRRRGLMM